MIRVGVGYDSHRFAAGGPMVLGGLRIDAPIHCAGHSDGDAVCHALTDAVLGAAGLGDIGALFPDTAPENAGRDSVEMLALALRQVHEAGWTVGQVDVVVIAQEVKIAPHREAMRQRLAAVLGVTVRDVSVKGKTNERMGWIGRGEGLAVIATATLVARAAQG
ncbi:MAG TPA: 2-C-methyl-D-erythritol 2,4-cyclodiphosphate synthase [Gemmatimonadaceae bacterium]|nr:2-C-methyl-D-erythritol 2,4-cyclodiphosphate synthase [Gemmatimonadaceae bacterium]